MAFPGSALGVPGVVTILFGRALGLFLSFIGVGRRKAHEPA
jgi:hypothetical protein